MSLRATELLKRFGRKIASPFISQKTMLPPNDGTDRRLAHLLGVSKPVERTRHPATTDAQPDERDRMMISAATDSDALLAVARAARDSGYSFTTVTPATHAKVVSRPENARARGLRDVLGWSRPFMADLLPEAMTDLMRRAGVVEEGPEGLRAKIRLSSLDDELFVHSAYPPTATDAVFFGPDTVRFVSAVLDHLAHRTVPPSRVVDIGCGSGAAGIVIAKRLPEAEVVLVDINLCALRMAGVNARLAGTERVKLCQSDMLSSVEGSFDLIVSNPPFMIDPGARAYRHGGGELGSDLSLTIIRTAADRLAPGGSLVLFTGSAIIEGGDPFRDAAQRICSEAGLDWSYREFDPDAYAEELDTPGYARAERIALVVLTATRATR